MRRITMLLLAEGAVVGLLVAARGAVVPAGFAAERVDDLLVLGLWVGAVAVSAWVLATTAAYVAVEVVPATPARVHRAVARVTPRAVRVAVTRTLALSVLAALATPAAVLAIDEPVPGVRTGREAAPATDPLPAPAHEPGSPPHEPATGVTPPDAAPVSGSEHDVAPGEHLWSIAESHLYAVRGGTVGEREVARYWLRVVDDNRSTLRSGDPDLIFPGEVVGLPGTRS